MCKWKEYDEVEVVLEDEVFDCYVLSMLWFEELFFVDVLVLEGVFVDGYLFVGDVEGNVEM